MHRINWLLTLSSLNIVLVIIERFSFTTKVLLQPYDFLRLHELIQMTILILISTVIPFFLLRELSQNFKLLQQKKGMLLALLFLIGVYFYATGNGFHEAASFTFNTYCDSQKLTNNLCRGLYINDYYTGNSVFYVGAIAFNLSLLWFQLLSPYKKISTKDTIITLANAAVFAFVLFSVAIVNVRLDVYLDLYYLVVMAIIALLFLWHIRKTYRQYPVIVYTSAAYASGALIGLLIVLR